MNGVFLLVPQHQQERLGYPVRLGAVDRILLTKASHQSEFG